MTLFFGEHLDERFFDNRGRDVPKHNLWRTRTYLLGETERRAMQPFAGRKTEEQIIITLRGVLEII